MSFKKSITGELGVVAHSVDALSLGIWWQERVETVPQWLLTKPPFALFLSQLLLLFQC